jgi:hypothetical protein
VVLIYATGRSGNSLWDFCRRRGWDNDAQVVHDLDVLMRLVRAGKVEVLLCASLSRLDRSVPELVTVLRDFAAHKSVLIIPGRTDTSKLSSKAFLTSGKQRCQCFERSHRSQLTLREKRKPTSELVLQLS